MVTCANRICYVFVLVQLAMPEKVAIPERYVEFEPEEQLSPQEAEARYQKVERIKNILAKSRYKVTLSHCRNHYQLVFRVTAMYNAQRDCWGVVTGIRRLPDCSACQNCWKKHDGRSIMQIQHVVW